MSYNLDQSNLKLAESLSKELNISVTSLVNISVSITLRELNKCLDKLQKDVNNEIAEEIKKAVIDQMQEKIKFAQLDSKKKRSKLIIFEGDKKP